MVKLSSLRLPDKPEHTYDNHNFDYKNLYTHFLDNQYHLMMQYMNVLLI